MARRKPSRRLKVVRGWGGARTGAGRPALSVTEHERRGTFRRDRHGRFAPPPEKVAAETAFQLRVREIEVRTLALDGLPGFARLGIYRLFDSYRGRLVDADAQAIRSWAQAFGDLETLKLKGDTPAAALDEARQHAAAKWSALNLD